MAGRDHKPGRGEGAGSHVDSRRLSGITAYEELAELLLDCIVPGDAAGAPLVAEVESVIEQGLRLGHSDKLVQARAKVRGLAGTQGDDTVMSSPPAPTISPEFETLATTRINAGELRELVQRTMAQRKRGADEHRKKTEVAPARPAPVATDQPAPREEPEDLDLIQERRSGPRTSYRDQRGSLDDRAAAAEQPRRLWPMVMAAVVLSAAITLMLMWMQETPVSWSGPPPAVMARPVPVHAPGEPAPTPVTPAAAGASAPQGRAAVLGVEPAEPGKPAGRKRRAKATRAKGTEQGSLEGLFDSLGADKPQ